MIQQTREIMIAGRRVPCYIDNRGQMVVANDHTTKLVLGFVGSALATPVTGLTIVIGNAIGDIYVTYTSVVEDIKTSTYEIKAQAEVDRMNSVFRVFAGAISQLSESNDPDAVKEQYANHLKRRMEERLRSFKN